MHTRYCLKCIVAAILISVATASGLDNGIEEAGEREAIKLVLERWRDAIRSEDAVAVQKNMETDGISKPLVESVVRRFLAARHLYAIVEKRFGTDAAMLEQSPVINQVDKQISVVIANFAEMDLKKEGEYCLLLPRHPIKGLRIGQPLYLRAVNGQWKIDLPRLLQVRDEQDARRRVNRNVAIAELLEESSNKVNAVDLVSVVDVINHVNRKMKKVEEAEGKKVVKPEPSTKPSTEPSTMSSSMPRN